MGFATLDPLAHVVSERLDILQIVVSFVLVIESSRLKSSLKVLFCPHPPDLLSLNVLLLLIWALIYKLFVIPVDPFLIYVGHQEKLDYLSLHRLHLDVVILVQLGLYVVANLL